MVRSEDSKAGLAVALSIEVLRHQVQSLLALHGSRTLAAMKANPSGALLAATEAARKADGAHNSQASNHSIERTHNGEAHMRASSRSAAPLRAAHVER